MAQRLIVLLAVVAALTVSPDVAGAQGYNFYLRAPAPLGSPAMCLGPVDAAAQFATVGIRPCDYQAQWHEATRIAGSLVLQHVSGFCMSSMNPDTPVPVLMGCDVTGPLPVSLSPVGSNYQIVARGICLTTEREVLGPNGDMRRIGVVACGQPSGLWDFVPAAESQRLAQAGPVEVLPNAAAVPPLAQPAAQPSPEAAQAGAPIPPGVALDGDFTLRASHSNKCLDVSEISRAPGAMVWQYECHGGDNQRWQIRYDRAGFHEIRAAHSALCLEIAGGEMVDIVLVRQNICTNADNQKFAFVTIAQDLYTVRAKHSGKCLHVNGDAMTNATAVVQLACDGRASEAWFLATAQAPAAPPPPEPSRPTVDDPRDHHFYVFVKTADREGAGTDATIKITLRGRTASGEERTTEWIELNGPGNLFERDQIDTFDVGDLGLFSVDAIIVGNFGGGGGLLGGSNWNVEWVCVLPHPDWRPTNCAGGFFGIDQWLDGGMTTVWQERR